MNGTTYRWLLLALILLVVLSVYPAPVQAAGVVGDGTPGSCTQAAFEAALSGGGAVTFNCGAAPHTIAFSSEISIANSTSIDGGGLITFDGLGSTRLFYILGAGITVDFEGVTFANGFDPGGGAIENFGTLTISNSTFSGNSADFGGAIYNFGTLTISNSTFSGNSADFGGAIENFGTLTISNSVLWNNTAVFISPDCGGTLNTNGVNYFGDTSGCTLTGTGTNIVGTDPQLSALYNGAYIPLYTSPLIDAATGCSVADDQFGTARPQGAGCEVGAVERPDILASPAAPAIGEDGTTDTLTFTLAAAPFAAVSFDLDTDGQCLVDGGLATTVTLTAANWDTGAAVTVSADDDVLVEGAHTCAITVNAASSTDLRYDNTDPDDITADITDNEVAPDISIADAAIEEGDSGTTTLTFTVTRSDDTVESSVDWATEDIDAIAGDDYTGASGTITFLSDDDTADIDIELLGDTDFEPDETFFVNLSNPVAANITDGQAIGTIRNDDTEPTLEIDDVTQDEGNGGTTTFTFTVMLNGATGDPVSVDWTTTDDTATTADNDYVADNGTLNFGGATTTQTIAITVNGDTALESDEQFFVDLSNVTGTAIIGSSRGIGTITNDDALPDITIADATVAETDGATTVDVTLTRTGDTGIVSSVQVDTADGSASAGTDYTAVTAQVVSFGVGVTEQTVTIDINGDNVAEGDETFTVNLSNPTLATIGDNQATVTITDDDTAGVVVNPTPIAISEDGPTSASYTLTLDTVPTDSVTITLSYDAAQCTVTPPDQVVFNAGTVGPQTVTVQAVDDDIPEASPHQCTILHDASTSADSQYAAIGNVIAWVTANITDNDLTFTPATLPDGEISVAYNQTVTVSDGTAPYTISQGGTLPPGLGFIDNGDGTATISGTPTTANTYNFTLTATDSNSVSDSQDYTVTIVDTALPTISFATGSVTVSQGEGDSGLVTVTLEVQRTSTSGVSTVTYATADGTATGGSDYITINPVPLTFNDGEDTRTIQVTINGDTLDEDDETFTVNLSNPIGANLGTATATITIVDDDAAPTISIGDYAIVEGNSGTTAFQFTVSLSAASSRTITVNYATADGTATVTNNDYVAVSDTLTFAPGDDTEIITVNVNGDTTLEPDETFVVNLSGPTNATLTDAQGEGTIINDDAAVTITISPTTLPNGTVGTAYNQTLTASGGTGPYTYNVTAGSLPDGLNLDANTGVIDGTPSVASTFNFTVTATDANSDTGTQAYTVIISPAGGGTIVVGPTPPIPGGTIGTAYTQTFTASGGTAPYTFSSLGTLPTGLTLTDNGDGTATLAGTPTVANAFSFTIVATDATSDTGSESYTVTITGALVVVNPTTLPNGIVGQTYNQTFSASGGSGNYTFSRSSGQLPPGLTLNPSGTLSGTPTTSNTYNFTIRAQDTLGNAGTRSYSLVISPAAGGVIVISPDVLANGVLAQFYSATLSASGGTAPYTFSVTSGSLPPGLALDTITGIISGTPTTEGAFSFTIEARDSTGRTGQRVYTLTIGTTAGGGTGGTGEGGEIVQPTATPLPPLTVTVSSEVGGLALRTGPYLGATLIGGLTPGVEYSVSAQSTDEGGEFIWYYVTDGTISGWASGRYLVFNRPPDAFPGQGSIFDAIDDAPDVGVLGRLGTFTDMRRRPSPRTTILQQLDMGTTVTVIGRTRQNGGNFWFHIRYNGQVGWISGSLVIIRGNIEDVPIR